MANKYIRHGETYNGNGTSPDAATSNGGVGAWNTITYMENNTTPAYGSLAAGDTVYVRSKDAGGADITRTLGAALTLGSNVATVNSRITWVIDGGNVWSGVSGTVKWTTPSYTLSLLDYNNIYADVQDAMVAENTNAAINGVSCFSFGECDSKNMLVSHNVNSSGLGCHVALGSNGDANYHENLHIVNYERGQGLCTSGGRCVLVNPHLELTSADGSPLFELSANGPTLAVYGGKVTGIGATAASLANWGSFGGNIQIVGLAFPNEVTMGTTPAWMARVTGVGIGGIAGGLERAPWGYADSRNDGYYPTLNATIPDSASTPWSWKVYADNTSPDNRLIQQYTKIYTQSAAAKKITLELLIRNGWVGTPLLKGNTWVTVIYTDESSGYTKMVSSFVHDSTSDLDTSTASWSSTTYGALSLNKRKIEVTTPTSIKQDTMIHVILHSYAISSSGSDIFFVCPDFIVATP